MPKRGKRPGGISGVINRAPVDLQKIIDRCVNHKQNSRSISPNGTSMLKSYSQDLNQQNHTRQIEEPTQGKSLFDRFLLKRSKQRVESINDFSPDDRSGYFHYDREPDQIVNSNNLLEKQVGKLSKRYDKLEQAVDKINQNFQSEKQIIQLIQQQSKQQRKKVMKQLTQLIDDKIQEKLQIYQKVYTKKIEQIENQYQSQIRKLQQKLENQEKETQYLKSVIMNL